MKIDYPITFLYCKDGPSLERSLRFYQQAMDFPLVLDQGWVKYLQINDQCQLGLVDASNSSIKASENKPVLLSFVVDDVNAYHERIKSSGLIDHLPEAVIREDIGIHAFIFEDPEGFKVEIQKFLK